MKQTAKGLLLKRPPGHKASASTLLSGRFSWPSMGSGSMALCLARALLRLIDICGLCLLNMLSPQVFGACFVCVLSL